MTGCRACVIIILAFFLIGPNFVDSPASASEESGTMGADFEPVKPTKAFQHTAAGGVLMLCILGTAFFAMTRYNVRLPLDCRVYGASTSTAPYSQSSPHDAGTRVHDAGSHLRLCGAAV